MRKITIREQQKLPRVSALLRDQFFEPARIRYSASDHRLFVPFFYQSAQHKVTVKAWGLVRDYEYSLLEGSIHVCDVASHTVQDHSRIGRYTIDRVDFDPDPPTIRIVAHENLQIAIVIHGMNATVQWLDNVVGRMCERSVFGLGQWGPILWEVCADRRTSVVTEHI